MALINRPPRGKEVELKLKDSQFADVYIGILLGMGLRNNEEIGKKVGYSGIGVRNRRNGVNAVLISAVEKFVKHEIEVSRKNIEVVAATEFQNKLGERAGQVLSNLDDALKSRDAVRADRAALKITDKLLPRSNARGEKPAPGPAPNVYHVRVKSLQVVQQFMTGEPITLPDQEKLVNVTPQPGEQR